MTAFVLSITKDGTHQGVQLYHDYKGATKAYLKVCRDMKADGWTRNRDFKSPDGTTRSTSFSTPSYEAGSWRYCHLTIFEAPIN